MGSSRLALPAGGQIRIAGYQAAMQFEQGIGLHERDDIVQQLAEQVAFIGVDLALGVLHEPMRQMPIQQRDVNAVFVQSKLQYPVWGYFDWAGGPSKEFFPRHDARLTAEMA
jgi:hypothetical protein